MIGYFLLLFLGYATVNITVTDVNDNAPSFTQNPAQGEIEENGEPRTNIIANLQDITTDRDLSPNRGPFKYELLNYNEKFII